jgi:hypothetical protein
VVENAWEADLTMREVLVMVQIPQFNSPEGEDEYLEGFARETGAYRIYKCRSEPGGDFTDYHHAVDSDQEAGILGSPFIHDPVLVWPKD